MDQLLSLRKKHGEVFATELPNGQLVPWRPLTTEEFIRYNRLLGEGRYPPACIEDEIFHLCVLDKVLVDSAPKLKAGIVSLVSQGILSYSGPQGADELNYMLNLKRVEVNDAIHEIVGMICWAFPAYKPEDVYAMDYYTLMERAALSERKLLSAGLIEQPLEFMVPEQEQDNQQKAVEEQERLKRSQSMMDDYLKQQGVKVPEKTKKVREQKREQLINPLKTPPPPTQERTIITKSDMIEHEATLSGHDQDVVSQIQKTDETAEIYGDYLKQLQDGGQLEIKTDEERLAAAEKRMERNKQKLIAQQKAATEAAKKELPELLKVREEARKRKERKAARRRK